MTGQRWEWLQGMEIIFGGFLTDYADPYSFLFFIFEDLRNP